MENQVKLCAIYRK